MINKLYINALCRKRGDIAGLFIIWIVFLMAYFGTVALLSLWSDRCLEWSLSEWKGRPVEIHGGLSFLFTILAPLALTFNLVVEILRAAA
jgi:hypothetical protein